MNDSYIFLVFTLFRGLYSEFLNKGVLKKEK